MAERCPICGSRTGVHYPTAEERKLLRRVAWRAFWRGFFDPFGLRWNPKQERRVVEAVLRDREAND